MLRNLLAASKIPETMLYAGLGFLIVFVGIAFLILIVWMVGKIIARNKDIAKPAETIVSSIKQEVVSDGEEISEETVAVIMAALMAYYQTQGPKCEFTVRRIKRI